MQTHNAPSAANSSPSGSKKLFDDGSVYTGELRDGKRHGHGVMMWLDGDVYDGQWLNDRRQGRGRYTYANGDAHDGDWAADVMNGRGPHVDDGSARGESHEGEFVANSMHGEGARSREHGSVAFVRGGHAVSAAAAATDAAPHAGSSESPCISISSEIAPPHAALQGAPPPARVLDAHAERNAFSLCRHLQKTFTQQHQPSITAAAAALLDFCSKQPPNQSWQEIAGRTELIPLLMQLHASKLPLLQQQAMVQLHRAVAGHAPNQAAAEAAGVLPLLLHALADGESPALQEQTNSSGVRKPFCLKQDTVGGACMAGATVLKPSKAVFFT